MQNIIFNKNSDLKNQIILFLPCRPTTLCFWLSCPENKKLTWFRPKYLYTHLKLLFKLFEDHRNTNSTIIQLPYRYNEFVFNARQTKSPGFCLYGNSNGKSEVSYRKEVRNSLLPYMFAHRAKPKA